MGDVDRTPKIERGSRGNDRGFPASGGGVGPTGGGGAGDRGGRLSPTNVTRIYVGNLPSTVQKSDLEELFEKYGRIVDVSIKRTVSGAPFAFIEFEDGRDAEDAIKGRDGYNMLGSRLRVEIPFAARGGGRPNRSVRGGQRKHGEFRVMVTGLPQSGSWQDLKDHMREAGECVFADVYRDGTGVVEFTRRDDMEYAIRNIDGTKFKSHEGEVARITVQRSEEGGRYGGRSRSRSPRMRDNYRDRSREGRHRSRSPSYRGGRSPSRSRSRGRRNGARYPD